MTKTDSDLNVVRMVERLDRTGYRRVRESEYWRLRESNRIRFEGVDGDEETNTVTYWYTRETED